MSRQSLDSLDRPLRTEPGGIGAHESWWVERQEALERAGYMLRPRYRPQWKPSWAGTSKSHFGFEDGLSQTVSAEVLLSSACAHEHSATAVHGRDTNYSRKTRDVKEASRRGGSL